MIRFFEKLKPCSKVFMFMSFILFVIAPKVSYAASTGQVKTKLNSGFTQIQGVLTGVVVIIGVIAAIKIFIKYMPSLDDPHSKNEMWKSIGGVFIAVGGAAACVWILPWVYSLFT